MSDHVASRIKVSVRIDVALIVIRLGLIENILDHLNGCALLDQLLNGGRDVKMHSRHVAFSETLPNELFELRFFHDLLKRSDSELGPKYVQKNRTSIIVIERDAINLFTRWYYTIGHPFVCLSDFRRNSGELSLQLRNDFVRLVFVKIGVLLSGWLSLILNVCGEPILMAGQ